MVENTIKISMFRPAGILDTYARQIMVILRIGTGAYDVDPSWTPAFTMP